MYKWRGGSNKFFFKKIYLNPLSIYTFPPPYCFTILTGLLWREAVLSTAK